MITETRTVQAIARAQAAATFIEPEHSIMLALCDGIDALEKALKPFAEYGAAIKGQRVHQGSAILELWGHKITGDDLINDAALSPPSDNEVK